MSRTFSSSRYALAVPALARSSTSCPASADSNLFPQRNLNNAFAYDLVPSPSVLAAALRAARRVNDFPTAVRVFEGTTQPRCGKYSRPRTARDVAAP